MITMPEHVDRARDDNAAAGSASTAAPQSGEATHKRRRFLIIHNPVAGRNRVDLPREVARCLERAGAVADLHYVAEGASDAGLLARIDTYDALVASGGDGTARSIVSMLQGKEIPFGLIPAGTGNVLAEELQLPRDAEAITDMLLHGPVAGISTGTVNGAPLLLMLGAGFDGHVVAKLPIGLKRRIGKPAFGWPIMAALAHKPRPFTVTIDGIAHEASWLVISNAARYGGRFVLSERTNVLTPGFNIVISRALKRRERFLELIDLVSGHLEKSRTIEMIPGRIIEIPDAAAIAVQVDGEVIKSPSLKIVADVARTPIIVPRRQGSTA